MASRYDPLGEFLAQSQTVEFLLSWEQLEALVGSLPADAATPQFWANASDYHGSRRQQWLGNGFEAFYRPDIKSVLFRKVLDGESRAGEEWTVDELRGCMLAYRQMWDQQEAKQKINKTAQREKALATVLKGRSPGSFEFRMQNISEVLRKLGIRTIEGYRPAANIGKRIEAALTGLAGEFWNIGVLANTPTDDPEVLAARVQAARSTYNSGKLPPPTGNQSPEKRERKQFSYSRLASVVAYVEAEAKGRCEGCGQDAPFIKESTGLPFLEVHHVIQLSEDGPDTVENAVALCPNCHRRLHLGQDKATMRAELYKNISRLKK